MSQRSTIHVGHALLTKLLLPALLKTAEPNADVRVVVLASHAHTMVPEGGIRFDTLETEAPDMGTWTRCGQSKLANVLFGRELAQRRPQLKVVSVTPGVVDTNLTDTWLDSSFCLRLARPILKPILKWTITGVEQGVKNQLWAAFGTQAVSGEYYEPVGVSGKAKGHAEDKDLAGTLWDWTEKQLENREIQSLIDVQCKVQYPKYSHA